MPAKNGSLVVPQWFVVWNSNSGTATSAAELREHLETSPDVWFVEWAPEFDWPGQLGRAKSHGCSRLVAAGGDGTISSAFGAVVRQGDPDWQVGLIPLGTRNDFARNFKCPSEPIDVWKALQQSRPNPCDVIDVQWDGATRIAVNMVTAGNTGLYLEVLTEDMKRRWGPLCYLRGAVSIAANLAAFRATIIVDESTLAPSQWLNVFLANGRYSGGGLEVSPQATTDDGLLEFLAIADGDPLDVATLPADYLWGTVDEHPLVVSRRCREVRILAEEPWPWTADGEAFLARQVTLQIRPAAIMLLSPC